jgi:ubiquinone/menaquinone biosynthesis C-methylase UbiE/uncharacterized protein YbaR (Trm112 family)
MVNRLQSCGFLTLVYGDSALMWLDVIPKLCCPACGQCSLACEVFTPDAVFGVNEGVVYCQTCHAWYPLTGGVLELLTGDLAYPADRAAFWAQYQTLLSALHLPPDTKTAQTDTQQQKHQQVVFDADATEQTISKDYELQPFWQLVDQQLFAAWQTQIQRGAWLLDVGCAQGYRTVQFAHLDIQIVGMDISKRLAQQAAQLYRQKPQQAKIVYMAADCGVTLPMREASFDVVLVYGVLHHLLNPASICREITRILQPHGRYYGLENNTSLFRGMFELLQRLNPLWGNDPGEEELISHETLARWFANQPMRLKTQTMTYVPPHLVNVLPTTMGNALLKMTDTLGQALPGLREQGGLIVIEAVKSA